jgi:hypothetical protein
MSLDLGFPVDTPDPDVASQNWLLAGRAGYRGGRFRSGDRAGGEQESDLDRTV